jgi:hypothetical protein
MIGDYCPDRAASMLPTPRRRAAEVMNSVAALKIGNVNHASIQEGSVAGAMQHHAVKPKDKCADSTAQGQPRSAQSHRRRAERQSANC